MDVRRQLIEPKSVTCPLIAAVEPHRPDVGDEPRLVEAPDDPRAVGEKNGPPS